jgi:hypothetical protein
VTAQPPATWLLTFVMGAGVPLEDSIGVGHRHLGHPIAQVALG